MQTNNNKFSRFYDRNAIQNTKLWIFEDNMHFVTIRLTKNSCTRHQKEKTDKLNIKDKNFCS